MITNVKKIFDENKYQPSFECTVTISLETLYDSYSPNTLDLYSEFGKLFFDQLKQKIKELDNMDIGMYYAPYIPKTMEN